jgi:CheY-like chemotaxis protein
MSSYNIVYVEDDAISREVMRVILSEVLGHNVTIYADSADMVDRLQNLETQPDLVLLDIHMTPYTGLEVLQQLRQHPDYETTRIVAMTASVMNEEVDILRASDFDGCIAKPIRQDVFPDLLERVMQGESLWFIQ